MIQETDVAVIARILVDGKCFKKSTTLVGGNITGTMTTVEVRSVLVKNRTRRVHTMLVRLYCLVMFEFVPTDFDLCQPSSLCAHTTFSWDNCGNLLTKESAVYQIDWQWPLKFDPYILRSFGKYTSTYIYSYIL